MSILFGRVNANGFVKGENAEMFQQVSTEALEFVRDNARGRKAKS